MKHFLLKFHGVAPRFFRFTFFKESLILLNGMSKLSPLKAERKAPGHILLETQNAETQNKEQLLYGKPDIQSECHHPRISSHGSGICFSEARVAGPGFCRENE